MWEIITPQKRVITKKIRTTNYLDESNILVRTSLRHVYHTIEAAQAASDLKYTKMNVQCCLIRKCCFTNTNWTLAPRKQPKIIFCEKDQKIIDYSSVSRLFKNLDDQIKQLTLWPESKPLWQIQLVALWDYEKGGSRGRWVSCLFRGFCFQLSKSFKKVLCRLKLDVFSFQYIRRFFNKAEICENFFPNSRLWNMKADLKLFLKIQILKILRCVLFVLCAWKRYLCA